MNPQAAQMLQAYRSQGATKTKPIGAGGQPAVNNEVMETAKDRDTARSAIDLIHRIRPTLGRVNDLYSRNLKGAGPLQSLREYLPSQSNAEFDSAAAALQKLVRPATRTPGEGSMSDFESKLALKAVPDRWAMDGSNEESLRGLQSFLDESEAAYTKRAGLPSPPPKKKPAQSNGGWSIQEH